jgi:hypothetical protein
MTKPVTPQEMFDLWQKMVNPGGYPVQSLMFPILDPKEIDKKIGELEVVEHWLKANLNMLQLSMKSLEYQKAMLKGGERMQAAVSGAQAGEGGEMENPAMWAWNMMAQASKDMMEQVGKHAAKRTRRSRRRRPRRRRRRKASGPRLPRSSARSPRARRSARAGGSRQARTASWTDCAAAHRTSPAYPQQPRSVVRGHDEQHRRLRVERPDRPHLVHRAFRVEPREVVRGVVTTFVRPRVPS